MEILAILLIWIVFGGLRRFLQSAPSEPAPQGEMNEEQAPQWLRQLTAQWEQWTDAADDADPVAKPRPVPTAAPAVPPPPADTPTVPPITVSAPPRRRPLTHAEWRHAMVMATIFNPPRAQDPYRWPE